MHLRKFLQLSDTGGVSAKLTLTPPVKRAQGFSEPRIRSMARLSLANVTSSR